MSVEAIILAALLSVARAPAVDVGAERPRLEALATDVAGAADDVRGAPFAGPAAREAAGLALVAIALHESAFRADVQDCRRRGDPTKRRPEGRSITLWQLLGPWAFGGHMSAELCASPRLAGAQALRVLARHAIRCSSSPWLATFRGYAAGSCGRETWHRGREQGRVRCETWARLAARAGLVGATCDGPRRPITRTP